MLRDDRHARMFYLPSYTSPFPLLAQIQQHRMMINSRRATATITIIIHNGNPALATATKSEKI